MLINYTLSSIVNIASIVALMIAIFNIVCAYICDKRIYLKDSQGRMSTTLFTGLDLHLVPNTKLRQIRGFMETIVAALAVSVVASFIAGLLTDDPAIKSMGPTATFIFILFGLCQVLRSMAINYILEQLPRAKAKSVKIDSTMHYIVTVKQLPWLIRERFSTAMVLGVIASLLCYIFY